ncbi:MAG TPA: hypothetical protein VMD07_00870 [Candidatus Acidoferrales bacterium]|nr:hypothetical protein [Candidatus Acidoferrales bacterium]
MSTGPIVHDIRNHLAIAIANIEAIADGKLEPTPKRFTAVLEALRAIDGLLSGLRLSERETTGDS